MRLINGIPKGALLELAVLGKACSIHNEEPLFTGDYRKFEDCIRIAKKVARQDGWNAHKPDEKLLISHLLSEIRQILRNINKKNITVSIFLATNTPLDLLHSVDGFFTAKFSSKTQKSTHEARFYFDLSLNPEKKHKKGVDIFREDDFYKPKLKNTAKRVTRVLQKQLQSIPLVTKNKKKIKGASYV